MRLTRLYVTLRSRPRATKALQCPTSGLVVPRFRVAPGTWCCATPLVWLSTVLTTDSSLTHGHRRVIKPPLEHYKVVAVFQHPAQPLDSDQRLRPLRYRIEARAASLTASIPTATAPI